VDELAAIVLRRGPGAGPEPVGSGELALHPIDGGPTNLLDRPGRRSARSERELVDAARDGAADAFEALYRRHWPSAYRTAYLIVRDAAAAEDIAQEAFLRAAAALDRFDRRRPFGPWLHRIVANRALDWARARAVRREVGADPLEAVAAAEPARADDDLAAAMADLPPDQRAVVVLRYLLEYTPGEIADLLDLPRGTVNSRMRRALDALEREFRE
jgi:RNA polymerase sigma-70 factor (ECF subfamily)